MWKIFLFLGLCASGVSAGLEAISACNPRKCESLRPKIIGSPEFIFPTSEILDENCPSILEFNNCLMDEVKICFGQDLHEMMHSHNESFVAVSTVFLALDDLLNDVCDSNSDLHKKWKSHSECMRDVLLNPLTLPMCALEAETLYKAFIGGPEGSRNEDEAGCMIVAHIIACASGDILQDCGDEARATMLEILKRSKLMKYGICPIDNFASLRNQYLQFLELGDYRQSIFEKAFDIKRRK